MADPYGNSWSNYYILLSHKPYHSDNIEVISSISFIWEDDHIDKLENNHWKCLWCNVKFQGINATKYLSHIFGTIFMHINICTFSIDKYYLSRYKELQQTKASNKGILNYYSQKMISSISRLQYKSSEVVESNIQRNSRGMSSSNSTATYDKFFFITICSTLTENNQITPQKGSILFIGDNNTHKMMTSNETRLTVAIADLIIYEGLPFNISHKPRFKKVLDLARTVSKSYQIPNKKLIY